MSSMLSFVFVQGLLCLFSIVNTSPIISTYTESDAPLPDDLLPTFHSTDTTMHQSSKVDNFEPAEGPAGATLPPEITSEKPDQLFEHDNVARDSLEIEEEEEESHASPESLHMREKTDKHNRESATWERNTDRRMSKFSSALEAKTRNQGYDGSNSGGEKKHFLFDNKIGPESSQLFSSKKRANNKGHFLFEDNFGAKEKLNFAGPQIPGGGRNFSTFYI